MKTTIIHFGERVKKWLQSLSFKTGVIVLLCCIPFYILSFAQILLPISVAAKGVLWTILFGLAKTCQYGGLTILGVEGYNRLKNWMKQKKKKQFHRHFATPGLNLYWIIIAYIIIGWFYPVIGLLALICMIGPVLTSIWRGRFWCGNICPRGNLYDRLLSKYSPHKPIPAFVRTFGFRLFMVFFIFSMFGIQLTLTVPWSEGGLAMWSGIGRVFWTIIVVTTIVGVTLSFIYAPRTWCSFCPMGTISSWVAPKHHPLPKPYTAVHVAASCQMKCKSCARVCPMQLTPYDSRGQESGYLHSDCLKCGKCILACPTKIMSL